MTRADLPDHILGPDEIPTVSWQDTTPAKRPGTVRDWHLLVGAVVEVRRGGRVIRTGLVDDATSSGETIWIAADGFDSRTMIEKLDGYELAIVPAVR